MTKATPVRRRSQGRMLALQALCLFDSLGDDFRRQLEEFLNDSAAQADLGLLGTLAADARSFARELVLGAWAAHKQYDEMLDRTVPQWTVRRMPPVDRNILRLGLFELLEQPQTPHEVVINEAIDLARRFGDTDSPAFVNGVLDALRREFDRFARPAAPDQGSQSATEVDGGHGPV